MVAQIEITITCWHNTSHTTAISTVSKTTLSEWRVLLQGRLLPIFTAGEGCWNNPFCHWCLCFYSEIPTLWILAIFYGCDYVLVLERDGRVSVDCAGNVKARDNGAGRFVSNQVISSQDRKGNRSTTKKVSINVKYYLKKHTSFEQYRDKYSNLDGPLFAFLYGMAIPVVMAITLAAFLLDPLSIWNLQHCGRRDHLPRECGYRSLCECRFIFRHLLIS